MDKLISFDNVSLAKKKGFPQHGNELIGDSGIYKLWEIPQVLYVDNKVRDFFYNIEAKNRVGVIPTQTTMCKWLREKHQIFVEPHTNRFGEHLSKVKKFNKLGALQSSGIECFNTYELAVEYGITKALNYLKDV